MLGRLDGKLQYKTLDNSIMAKLVEKQINFLNQRLKDKSIKVDLDPTMTRILIERGYDERYGARPLQSVFNQLVIKPLSHLIIKDEVDYGSIVISYENGKTNFSYLEKQGQLPPPTQKDNFSHDNL